MGHWVSFFNRQTDACMHASMDTHTNRQRVRQTHIQTQGRWERGERDRDRERSVTLGIRSLRRTTVSLQCVW